MSRRKTAKGSKQGAAQQPEAQDDELRLRAAAVWVALFFGVGLLVFLALFVYSFSNTEAQPPKAAIVDQLSLTVPNSDFVETATETLERAGYIVDYYPGEEVTVGFYRRLPTHDYDLIILRNHAATPQNSRGVVLTELFTSELYSPSKYVKEQRLGHLAAVAYDEEGEVYFGIGPAFIVGSMRGGFDDTTVIMMGCNGLTTDVTAEAFVRKGADAFVSWSDLVSAGHTDAATLSMLGHMLGEELSAQEAAEAAMAEVGPDPFYGSVLLSYPPE